MRMLITSQIDLKPALLCSTHHRGVLMMLRTAIAKVDSPGVGLRWALMALATFLRGFRCAPTSKAPEAGCHWGALVEAGFRSSTQML